MNTPASEEGTVWSGLSILFRAFAARARNWIVLARNLVPVVGVYWLGWSKAVAAFSYWFDGISMVGLIIAALCVRVPEEKFRASPWSKWPVLILVTFLCGAIAFGMCGIPYWIAYAGLNMEFPAHEVWRNHSLAASFLLMLAGNFVNAFQRGGYMTLSNEELRARWEPDISNLVARAMVMIMITYWQLGFLLVPVIALLLTGIEVWPTVRADVMPLQGTASQTGARGR